MKAGWELKLISEFAQTGAGGTPTKGTSEYYDGGTIPWLLSGEVANANITEATKFITEKGLAASSAKLFPKGSVLVAMYGATAGEVGILRFEASTNQAVCAIKPNKDYVTEYLYYYLLKAKALLASQATGGAQPNISQAKIKSLPIPLPPLEEQKRIVSILDEAFEGLDRARENAKANLKNARELFERGLDAVIADAGKDCIEYSLSDLCVVGDGNHSSKYPKKSEMVAGGVPFIRSTNIQKGSLETSDLLFISPEKHAQLKKGHLKTGDVLFTNRGEIGKVAIVPNTLNGSNLNSQVAWLRCLAVLDEHFLFYFLQSSKMKRHYSNTKSGTGLQQFTIKMLKSVMLPLPSVERQKIAMQKLNRLNVQFKAMENSFATKLQDISDLRQSLLQKAFAGELT